MMGGVSAVPPAPGSAPDPGPTSGQAPEPMRDPMVALWRGAQAFRLASLAYALGVQVTSWQSYAQPALSWLLITLQVIWTGVAVTALSLGRRRRPVVIVDILVTLSLVASSYLVAPPAFWRTHESLPTTLWSTNAVISAALLWGPLVGVLVALPVALACNAVSDTLADSVFRDATVPVLTIMGLVIGLLRGIVTRANEQLRQAIGIRAAAAERERLAREVHDGALQVLALVHRRGGTVDAELAALAGTQERALRRLLAAQPQAAPSAVPDLAAELVGFEGPFTAVSVPSEPVALPPEHAADVLAAVRAALHNTERHAPGARSFVLVEDLGDEVVVTVRDDGPGIPEGRVEQAAAEGRLGVAQSIRGRMAAAGGSALLRTGPQDGTEWELHIPRIRPGRAGSERGRRAGREAT